MSAGRFGWVWLFPVVAVIMLIQGCTSEAQPIGPGPDGSAVLFRDRVPELPDSPYRYDESLPQHLPSPSVTPNNDAVTLGRVLFFDVNLSSNRSVRCAACHSQRTAFTDPQTLSLGVRGATVRHSMSLSNLNVTPDSGFFWDQRVDTLEAQITEALTGPTEMDLPLAGVVERVAERDFYPDLFERAYGDPGVNEPRVLDALAQFVRSMVSYRSLYDEGRAMVGDPTEDFPNFDDVQNQGRQLFFSSIDEGGGGCSSCHSGESQAFTEARNNGLTVDDVDPFGRVDPGRFRATGIDSDIGLFRAPSLRNVEVTEPYMHDARFGSLEDVVDHYNSGIADHPNLDPLLRGDDGQPVRLGWTPDQVESVVAFLKTLTDQTFLTDPRFSDPFS